MSINEWLQSLGFNLIPVLDGVRHRCDRNGTKKDDSVWYIGSEELLPNGTQIQSLTIGDWTTSEKHTYFPNGKTKLTDNERQYLESKRKKAIEDAEKEQAINHETAALLAQSIWQGASVSGISLHPYIRNKRLEALCEGSGIRITGETLLIPMRDISGKLWGLQQIYPDGTKRFLRGQKTQGLVYVIGGAETDKQRDKENVRGDEADNILIAEGFATGCTVAAATGLKTYVAFNAGNVGNVGRIVAANNTGHIVFCGDDDRWGDSGKNIGREKAIEAATAVGGIAVFPDFSSITMVPERDKPTDFNDLMLLEGIDEVKRQITEKTIGSNPANENATSVDEGRCEEARDKPRGNGDISEDVKDEKETAPIEFPVECLGPIATNVVKSIADKVSIPIEMVAGTVLAGMSVCVQDHYSIHAFGGEKPISIYLIAVADSGDRKTTGDKIALRPHNTWMDAKFKEYEKEKNRYKAELEQYKNEAAKKQSRTSKPKSPKAPMLFVKSPTMEGLFFCLKHHRDSVGLFNDEGGSWLGSYSMKQENVKATLALLNSLWDGSRFERIRRGKEDEGEVESLYHKKLSMHLMMQPRLAHELFSNKDAHDIGFLARCLICEPKSKVGERKFLYNLNFGSEMKDYEERVWYFLNRPHPEKGVTLHPTDGAVKLVEELFYELEPLQRSGETLSHIKGFAAKLPEHCLRVAAIITAFNEPGATVINESMMRDAIKIGRFYLHNQLKTTEKAKTSFSSIHYEALYQTICKKSKWHLRDLMRIGPKAFRKRSVMLPAIESMVKDGLCLYDKDAGEVSQNS